MSFYESLRDDTAGPLVRRLGTPIALLRKADPEELECEFDPVLGREVCIDPETEEEVDPEEEQVYEGYAIVESYEQKLIDEALVKAGDRKLYAVGIPEPKPESDRIRFGTRVYSVVKSLPVAPGGVAVMYEVQVR